MTREEKEKAISTLHWLHDNTFLFRTTEDDVKFATEFAIQALEQEPCDDCISRKSIKQKLQEQHDFFVNAYGGFSNLPQNDKSRVDEITNCIALVVNEPPVTSKQKIGRWILTSDDDTEYCTCSECGYQNGENWMIGSQIKFCQECGAKMVKPQESEDNE